MNASQQASAERILARVQRIREDWFDVYEDVASLADSDAAKAGGYSSLPALLSDLVNMELRETRRVVKRAEKLAESVTPTQHVTPAALPVTREMAAAGLIDGEHVDVIAKTMSELPADVGVEEREYVEQYLAKTASTARPSIVAKHALAILDRFNTDGREPNHEVLLAEPMNTLVYRRTRDGGMDIKAHLEREAAEQFETLINALSTPIPEDARPRKQRLGDAFSDLVDAAFNSANLPTSGGEKPHLALFLDYEVLSGKVGAATLASGTTVSASAARRLACDAELIPIVLNGDSVPLDLGRSHRLVNSHQRKALIARDRGCAFPDCPCPATWCDAHHIRHWVDGGKTDLANTVLLCRKHHRLIHHSEWTVKLNPAKGYPEFYPPKWIDPAQHPRRNTLRISRT